MLLAAVLVDAYAALENRAARAILTEGFHNACGTYGMLIVLEGIFVSDRPIDCNEGAKGDALLSIELAASENELADFEIVEDGKTWREWIVPAKLLNAGRRSLLMDEGHIRDDRFHVLSDLDHEDSPPMVHGTRQAREGDG